ncbi:MAG TPA: redoxin domain-containing protein [Gemmatimonadaceae bacterium]|nr:redoxin domain-containing protein [Gemmatimonadaceae bacterium]
MITGSGNSVEAASASENSRDVGVDAVLQAGTRAPPFTLRSTPDQSYSLSDFQGRPVVLAFYPADWSPVCGDQMTLYNEMREEFARYGAQVMGISVDGVWCHKAFAEARRIRFPLLSDFEPKGEVSRRYGAYVREEGFSARALFVIDGNGVIQWSYLSPLNVNPGADGIFAALDRMVAGDDESSRRDKELAVSAAVRGDSAQLVRDERTGSGGTAGSSREQRSGEMSAH